MSTSESSTEQGLSVKLIEDNQDAGADPLIGKRVQLC